MGWINFENLQNFCSRAKFSRFEIKFCCSGTELILDWLLGLAKSAKKILSLTEFQINLLHDYIAKISQKFDIRERKRVT